MKYAVKLTQVYRVVREAVIEVYGEDEFDAVEQVCSGSVDLPNFDDEIWQDSYELVDEGAQLA